jgi:HEAT repeat protein
MENILLYMEAMRRSQALRLLAALTTVVGCSTDAPSDGGSKPVVTAPATTTSPPRTRAARLGGDSVIRTRAALDPASVAVLERAMASSDYATRLIAIEAIGDGRADALLGWLEHALGDPEHDVRMAAVEALDRIRSPRAMGVLVTVRDDTTEELDIRAVAAGALLRTTP